MKYADEFRDGHLAQTLVREIERLSAGRTLQVTEVRGGHNYTIAPSTAVTLLRAHSLGRAAAFIGEVRAEPQAMVFLRSEMGGTRVLDMLVGDPLPRIC